MYTKTEKKLATSSPIYWDGILDLVNLDTKGYSILLEKLKNREYKSLKIELKSTSGKYPVYGMYLDDTIRVLATQFEVDKKKYLLLVEVMLDHNYGTSRFMKDEVRDAYMDKHLPQFMAFIRKEENKRVETEQAHTKDDARLVLYKPVMMHQNKIISLSAQQEALLVGTNKTLLVEGGPGSGKTVLAKALLAEQLKRYTGAPSPETLVYITQSAALTRKTSELWELQPHYNPYGKRVLFRTYDAIVKEHLRLRDEDLVGKDFFIRWMLNYFSRAETKQNAKLRTYIEANSKQKLAELLYREFRILSGYNQKQYASKEQACHFPSLFPDQELREWIVDAYIKYGKLLESEHKWDTALIAPEALRGISFDYMVLDEAQDLSFAQLMAVFSWRKRNQIAVLKDENQNINGDHANTDFITSLGKGDDCQRVLLKGSFRCSEQVIQLANQVLALKFFLTRGVKTKLQQCQIELTKDQKVDAQQRVNAVQWIDSFDDISNKEQLLKTINESPDVLVVTSERYKDKARNLFKTGLVLSIEDIHLVKGLQFAKVILYQVLDDNIYARANEEPTLPRGAEVLDADVPHNRPKDGQECPEYAPPFDKLFVALTRCAGERDGSGEVLVIQRRGHKQEHLVDFLKKRTFGDVASKSSSISVDVSQLKGNTAENWLDQAKTALENNNPEFALLIFKTKLNKTEAEFKHWQKGFESEKAPESSQLVSVATVNVAPAPTNIQRLDRKEQCPQLMTTEEAVNKAVIEKNAVLFRKLFNKKHAVCDLEAGHHQLIRYLLHSRDANDFFAQMLLKPVFFKEFAQNKAIPGMLCAMNQATNNPVLFDFLNSGDTFINVFKQLICDKSFLSHLVQEEKLISSLLSVCSTKDQVGENVSLFAFLSAYTEGVNILEYLIYEGGLRDALVAHPDFIAQLTCKIPGRLRQNKAYVLLNLCIVSQESNLVLFLLNHPEFFKQAFSSEEFIRALVSIGAYGEQNNFYSTPFFWLFRSSSEELDAFAKNLTANTEAINKLCQLDEFYTALLMLFKPPKTALGAYKDEQTSALFWMIESEEFRSLFKYLCGVPGFLKKLLNHHEFINTLLARRTANAGTSVDQSVLSFVTFDDYQFFQAILKNEPLRDALFADQRFYDCICAQYSRFDDETIKLNFLSDLICYRRCSEVVPLLFKNQTFFQHLRSTDAFITALLSSIDVKRAKTCAPSLLFEMILVNLDYIIDLFSCPVFCAKMLMHKDFIKTLTYSIDSKNHFLYQVSIIWLLCMRREEDLTKVDVNRQKGLDLFNKLCSHKTFFNKLVTSDLFVDALLKIRSDHGDDGPLKGLMETETGLVILKRMYENDVFRSKLITHPQMNTNIAKQLELRLQCPEQPAIPKLASLGNNQTFFATQEQEISTHDAVVASVCKH